MTNRKQSKRKKRPPGRPNSAQNLAAAARRPSTLREMVLSSRLGFAIAFAVCCIALYAIIEEMPPSLTNPVNENTARTLGMVLNALGIPVSTARDTVSEGGLAFKIVPECTPIFTAGLFLSFIVFYPATLRQKLAGIITGVPALYLGNLARLAATFMISRCDRRLFEVVHAYLGQVFTIFLVILVCIAWFKWIDRKGPQQNTVIKAAGFLARFALVAGCLFLVWVKVHHGYIRFIDQFMLFGFSLFGHHFNPARQTPLYYETFSIVTFTSIVLAIRATPSKTRIKQLAAGLGFLILTHLLHRIDNYLMVLFHCSAALTADNTLLLVGQYLLPVLFLIYSIRRQKQAIILIDNGIKSDAVATGRKGDNP